MINTFIFSNQRLLLSGNTIQVIEDDAFIGLKSLTSLILSYCGLDKMPPLGPVKDNLKILRLSSNSLFAIPADYFCGFTRLWSVSLDFNKLLVVPNITPLKRKLVLLELDRNQITSLEPFLTNTIFPTMRQLSVTYNKITYLSRDMIICWPKLISLHLTKNLLKSLEDLSGEIRVPSASLKVRYRCYLIYAIKTQYL